MASVSLYALATILALLALHVARHRREPIHRHFAGLVLSITAWVLGIAGVESGLYTDFWGRITFAAASLIPATFLSFSHVFPAAGRWPTPGIRRAALAAAVALALLSLTTPLIAYDISRSTTGIARKSGHAYPLFTLYFLVCTSTALAVFIGKWLAARGLARAQLQYLGIGLLALIVGGTTTNLLIPVLTGRSQYSWLGPYFTLPLVFLVAHSIIRHRLMDLRLAIHTGLAYALAVGTVSAVLLVAGRVTMAGWRHHTLVVPLDILVITGVALIVTSRPVGPLFTRLVDRYLYRGTVDYAVALRDATHKLSRLMSPPEFAVGLHDILASTFVPESIFIAVRPLDGSALEQLGPDPPNDALSSLSSAVTALLSDQPGSPVLVLSAVDVERCSDDCRALRAAGVELVVPLGRRNQVLGGVLLGPRRSGDPYFSSDLTFLGSLAELASIALENALLYRHQLQMLEYSDRLLESLDSAVVAIDGSGHLTSFNPAARHLLGLPPRDSRLTVDDVPAEVAWALALAAKQGWRLRETETNIDHPSRGVVPVILSTAMLRDDPHRISGALAVVTDISTVKALERNERRMQHLATMARFYAGLAHEIRSPLASISTFVAMLPDRFDDPEYRDTATRLLPVEVARIVRLADRLRLMAPSEGGQLRLVSLPPLLADIVAIHAVSVEELGVKLTLQCADQLPDILGDPGQLVQLFVNLLRNAIEAMPNGGIVTIDAACARSVVTSESLVVRVIDEGAGIEPATRTSIFEPFFTTKPSGTGLGLSICREIAEFHGAALGLIPRTDGRGTIAQVVFPWPETALPGVDDVSKAVKLVPSSKTSHNIR